MNKSVAEIVISRAGGYCEKCGGPVGSDYALHHRKLRSQGGANVASNLLVLHHKCHNLGTDSVHLNPTLSQRSGYIVPSWGNPLDWPLARPDGSSVRLCDDGSVTTIETEQGNG